ncbi:MAG: hypothetical protein AAGD34_08550 [Pseudomonadota bacterium]
MSPSTRRAALLATRIAFPFILVSSLWLLFTGDYEDPANTVLLFGGSLFLGFVAFVVLRVIYRRMDNPGPD